MIQPKNGTEDLTLSITKNCETLIERTHKKAEKTLEFKLTNSRETIHFNPPVEAREDWMIGITDLQEHNSIFDITKEKNEFELYRGPLYDEHPYTTLKEKVAEVLGLSDTSPEDLEQKILGPDIIINYRKLLTEWSQTDGCYILPFRDFERYLRKLTGLNWDDIQILLKPYNAKLKTYEISSGVYTFKDLTMVRSRGFRKFFQNVHLRPDRILDKCDSILVDSCDVSLITQLTLRTDITALRFHENSFFNTILGFSPHWDFKNIATYEDYGERNRNLNTIDKIRLKCDVFDGSVLNGVRQAILYTFVLDKLLCYKVVCEPEKVHI